MLEDIQDFYHYVMTDKSDHRVTHLPLLSTMYMVPICCSAYLLTLFVGMRYMSVREALKLHRPLILYNLFLILVNGYIVYEIFMTTVMEPGFDLVCQKVDYSNDPQAKRLAYAIWLYFFSKTVEFLDTIFFVLRKKNSQVSFLHVYHHATMPMLYWMGARFVAGGSAYFAVMANSSIHVVMYTYYMLSAFGPAMQPYLWWKKHLTKLQLTQFFTMMFHTTFVIYRDCGFPRGYACLLMVYCTSLVFLFGNFYYHAYVERKNRAKLANGHTTNGHIANGHTSNGHTYTNGHTNVLSNGHSRSKLD